MSWSIAAFSSLLVRASQCLIFPFLSLLFSSRATLLYRSYFTTVPLTFSPHKALLHLFPPLIRIYIRCRYFCVMLSGLITLNSAYTSISYISFPLASAHAMPHLFIFVFGFIESTNDSFSALSLLLGRYFRA